MAAALLCARDSETLNKHRATADAPTQIHVCSDSANTFKNLPQITGDRHFVHWVRYLAIFHPKPSSSP